MNRGSLSAGIAVNPDFASRPNSATRRSGGSDSVPDCSADCSNAGDAEALEHAVDPSVRRVSPVQSLGRFSFC